MPPVPPVIKTFINTRRLLFLFDHHSNARKCSEASIYRLLVTNQPNFRRLAYPVEKCLGYVKLDLNRIRFLPPSEANDELFFAEDTRKVKKDNTFSFKNIRYETPVDLRDKQIKILFDRNKYDRIVIYYKDQRMGEAKTLDLIANGILRRKENSK